ncbi:hypothetical protein [Polyangium spumosum]|uniref:Uncharacterized protein n=1 Tax=Polyangium spumosum TaxID=889282 RepID=A0A6N7Q3C6_9BACT|nr:hypothetical protein [Polyangium spumosum]MRG98197.1 hypothetical protein [Polyangium spumosum]
MIPVLQAAAYLGAATLSLVALARKHRRLAAYVGLSLAMDLARLGLQQIPKGPKPYVGVDKLLFLTDGAMFLAPPILMGWALGTLLWPVVGLWVVAVAKVAVSYPELRGPALTRFYLAALVTGHVALLIGAVWKVVREGRTMRREEGLLLVLLAVGLSGAGVALWHPWRHVNAVNLTVYALLCLACFFCKKRKESEHRGLDVSGETTETEHVTDPAETQVGDER